MQSRQLILVRYQFFSDEIAQICKKRCSQYINCVMDMLYQYQDADRDAADQGDDFVALLFKTIKEKKLRGGMTGVEKVFGNKFVAVKGIA